MMADEVYSFNRESMRRVVEAVKRDKRFPRNSVQHWRAHKVNQQGTKDIGWALTPPGELMLIPPVAACMIAGAPEGTYEDGSGVYAEVNAFNTYCAGLFPGSWYPIHLLSKYVIGAGAMFVEGTAETACSAGGYFDLDVGTVTNPVIIQNVHSPAGAIEVESYVIAGWKCGVGEYVAVLEECG